MTVKRLFAFSPILSLQKKKKSWFLCLLHYLKESPSSLQTPSLPHPTTDILWSWLGLRVLREPWQTQLASRKELESNPVLLISMPLLTITSSSDQYPGFMHSMGPVSAPNKTRQYLMRKPFLYQIHSHSAYRTGLLRQQISSLVKHLDFMKWHN